MSDPALFDPPAPRRGRPRSIKMVRSLNAAIDAAPWLSGDPAYGALCEAARLLADRIDRAEDDRTRASLLKEYAGYLDRLGLTPRGRRLNVQSEASAEAVNPFAQARAVLESAWDYSEEA